MNTTNGKYKFLSSKMYIIYPKTLGSGINYKASNNQAFLAFPHYQKHLNECSAQREKPQFEYIAHPGLHISESLLPHEPEDFKARKNSCDGLAPEFPAGLTLLWLKLETSDLQKGLDKCR